MKARLHSWWSRLVGLLRRRRLEAEMAEEMQAHLAVLTERNIAAGMAPEAARLAAQKRFGGVAQIEERCRDERRFVWLDQLGQDLVFAGRSLRRERGFTTVALLILAIGVALNTTVFSLVDTVLLRPLPFADAGRLVWIFNGDPAGSSHDLSNIASQVDTWEGLRETSETLDRIEAYNPFSVRQTYRLTGEGEPETIVAIDVSHGLFGLLGVKPQAGRLFLPEDAVKNAPARVVLSHQLWRRRYGADPRLVGQTIQINGVAAEVIGVLPPADAFTSTFFPAVRVDVYGALCNDDARNWGNTVSLIGRSKPGASRAMVGPDLQAAVARLKQQYPKRNPYFSANVVALHDWVAGGLRRPLLFLWVAAGFVLAIVAFNLGGLLLARGATRQKELALRCALGAGRGRLARQLLTECGALVAVGSIVGGLVAWGFIWFLSVRSAVEIPLLQSLRFDATALGFTVLLSAVTVVTCGALPAWKLARTGELQDALKRGDRAVSGGRDRSRTRSVLVVGEVALACVLALSAALMVRSFSKLMSVDLGFQPHDLVAVRIDPAGPGPNGDYLEGLLDRVRALPGVASAGLTDCVPVERDRSWSLYPINRDNPKDQRWVAAHIRIVSPGLLGAMGTTLVAGRDFTRQDVKDAPGTIIINQSLARRFWPGEDAVGHQVSVGGRAPATVIGVAADVLHDGPEVPAGNEMYLSLHQERDAWSWDLMVRTTLPVATLTAGLRDALRSVDATLPLTKVRPMQTLVDRTLSSRRLLVWLVAGFAAIAVGLAALGLYGVISYMVAQRTKEIGIRMALGADGAVVRREVVRRTMRLAMLGLVPGLGAALVAGWLLRTLIFGVSAVDPLSYAATIAALLTCAWIAGYLPARRASRVDPLAALRAE